MPISYSLVTPVVTLPYDLPDLFAVPPVSVNELFKQLSYGELHDLKVGMDGIGSLKVERRNQVVHMANEGLKRLHQRFELICTSETITVPVSQNPLVVPLNSTVIQVVSLLMADGSPLTFLTHPVPGEIFVFNRKLTFPANRCQYEVQATYQKRHPLLRPISAPSDLEQPIYLSTEMWAALRAYIAGEMYGNMNTNDASAAAAKYRSRYEAICAEMEATGGTAQGMLGNQKFDMRGFV